MASPRTGQGKVFISFRWEDTRYSFVSHLYAALRRERISAFEPRNSADDNRGEIEGSLVSIVVISENYASSATCLDDLLKVIACRRKSGQLTIPVFFGVSRSDVAEQSGRFGEAFNNHLAGSYQPSRLDKWRKALAKTTRLPGGHDSGDKLSDSKLVENIVADVREKVYETEKIGINRRLVDVEDLLFDQSNRIRSLGIWGMGGVGKTTLAEAAFERMRGHCDVPCFIRDFDKKFREKGPYGLREDELGEILEGEVDKISFVTKPGLFVDKLRKKRLLIVLDDVRNTMDAESFLGGLDWFGPGSVIIITSRDKQVLVQCRVNHIYEVKGLSNEEALQLFSKNAFQKDKPDRDFEELSRKVIEYSRGHPKALSFYGGELKSRKTTTDMEAVFDQLKKSPPPEILDLFRSCYYALGDSEKNIFLDIACLLNGEKLERVMQILEGCGFFPRVGIEVLVEKSLVTISEDRLEMHNLIRDFGRRMSKGEELQIGRGCRLWEPSSIIDLIQYKETKATYKSASGTEDGTEDIQGIFLDISGSGFTINPLAFEGMYNLRLLKIYSSEDGNHLDLSKGLKSLPHELRLLHWENYPLESLPEDFDPRHLVELNMPNSQLQKLWGDTKNLSMLKTIMLSRSHQLVEISGLSKAPNLELIDLQSCSSLQSSPVTGHLQHLRVLNLSSCTKIKTFPEVPPNIRELYLEGTGITEVPESIENLSELIKLDLRNTRIKTFPEVPLNIRELYLEGTGITEVPESIENLSKLIKLDLGKCGELETVAGNIWRLKSLKWLNLSGCQKLTSFPEISDKMESLEHLDMSETAIDEVPSPIQNLPALRYLGLKKCPNITEVPDKLKELRTLKVEYDVNPKASS